MFPESSDVSEATGLHSGVANTSDSHVDITNQPNRIVRELDEHMAGQINGDYRNVRSAFRQMKNRKPTVPWGLRTEIWKMILYPTLKWGSIRHSAAKPEPVEEYFDATKWEQRNLFKSFRRVAEDSEQALAPIKAQWKQQPPEDKCEAPDTTIITERIKTVYKAMHQTRSVPKKMNMSWMFFQDKGNGKKGTAAMRGLHRICPWGKAIGKAITERGPRTSVPHYCHGCIKGRRKESALLVQLCGTWRLKKCGLSHITLF